MRVLIDLQAFQHGSAAVDALALAGCRILEMVKGRRGLEIEPLLAYDPRFPIDENPLFRRLALHCPPSSFLAYTFPPRSSADLGSTNANALLVEQTWLRANPDVVLTVDGEHGALHGQILPEAFPLAAPACWGALLVAQPPSDAGGLAHRIREEARLFRYHVLIDSKTKAADHYNKDDDANGQPPGVPCTANPIVPDGVQQIVGAFRAFRQTSGARPAARRSRLALFAPLEHDHRPSAAYYRAVLPYLARDFVIDVWNTDGTGTAISLQSPLSTRPGEKFESLADDYELIAYALDNTRETAQIIEYLQAYPGIAILHDRSFDEVFAALEEASSAQDICISEALFTHGTRARKVLAECGANAPSFTDLPLGRTLFELATSVVVFSPSQLADLESSLGRRWPVPASTARLIVQSAEDGLVPRASRRRDLGIIESDRVVIIPNGLFGAAALVTFAAQLCELAPPELKVIALDAVCPPTSDRRTLQRIRFTGPLSNEQRAGYLACADLAIHTCAAHPGWAELCLGTGIPIVFSDGKSAEYYGQSPAQTVTRDSTPAGIARFVANWARTGSHASEPEAKVADHYVNYHCPARNAGSSLSEALARLAQVSSAASPITLGDRLALIGRETSIPATELADVASALFRAPMTPRLALQRVLVDVTNTADREFVTGIERVVTEVTTRLCQLDRPGVSVEPITMRGSQLFEPTPWLFRHGLLRAEELPSRTGGRIVTPEAQDIMLMIDSSWDRVGDFAPHYRRVQAGAGAVYTVVYDLLPVQLPNCFESGAKAWFSRWIERAVELSDGLICISKAVADDLISHIRDMKLAHKPCLRIGYWHLGSKFAAREVSTPPSERMKSVWKTRPFLMVGTIEPRKRHALVLDAFEELWQQGEEVTLAIAGRAGWLVDSLMARLRNHAELGKRLYLIEGATDDELAFLYGNCHALIQASDNEGFGLPIIEAAQYGRPVILSDIPVFREIAGAHASYFQPGNAHDLARLVRDGWHGKIMTESHNIPWKTWDQSVEQLSGVILDQKWYRIID